MVNRAEMGAGVEDMGSEESHHYIFNVENLVVPFVAKNERGDNIELSCFIATILDHSDDEMLNKLRSSNESAMHLSGMIQKVSQGLKAKMISRNAPWLKELEGKILKLELFTASISHEMDLEQGKRDFEDSAHKLIEKIKKARLQSGDKGSSSKE